MTPAPESINVSLGKILERMMQHSIPDEDMPRQYRYRCLACKDVGVEFYLHPDYPDRSYARPCKHCTLGRVTLKTWRKPPRKSRKTGEHLDPVVWANLSDEDVNAILALPCAHVPVPEPVVAPLVTPASSSTANEPIPPDPVE